MHTVRSCSSTRRAARLLVVMVGLGVGDAAHASDSIVEALPTAKAADAAGRRAFAAGDYEAAARAFSRAYELDPDPRLAANLGEAYRRLGKCREALKFYGVYLKATTASPARARIASRAAELEGTCRAAPTQPLDSTAAPASSPRARDFTADAPPSPPEPIATESTVTREAVAARVQLALDGGVAFGRWSSARSTSPAVRLSGGSAWRWGDLELGVGLGLQWATFEYASQATAPEAYVDRAQSLETVIETRGRWHLAEWLAARIEVGAGVAWYGGFEAWNEIAVDGSAAAAGTTPAVRSALGVDVALGAGFGLRVNPIGVAWHPGATSGTPDAVHLLVGAGISQAF